MSSAEKAAKTLLDLEPLDFRILQAIELGMNTFSMVPLEELEKFSGLDSSEAEFRLKKLEKIDLVYRHTESYVGYILNYTGYDCLALNALSKANVLNSLGKSLGVGKEADIYEALNDFGTQVAVKFHRLGRVSFRETRKKRGYVGGMRHVNWLFQSRLAAEKEFQVLNLVNKGGVSVPLPINQNRHVVVMGYIEGYNLNDIDILENSDEFLNEIILNVRRTFRTGIIHADLSEFNVMVQTNGKVLLIDWPQAVTLDHPNFEELLERDVKNILTFFKRKHKLNRDLKEALRFIENGLGSPTFK